jgi:hypothetical protein
MNRFFRSGVYPALMVALLIKLPLAGQTNTGGILGTISDTTGAVVRNAEVSLLNEATGDHRSTVTSPTGDYSFAFLEPGRFTVTVGVPGFRKEIRNGIVLQLNQKARIDFELTVGQVTQEVAVTGQASLLNTDESTLGQVIENKRLIDLPLNGRNFSHLAALMPGVLVNRSSVTAFFGRDSAIAVSASGMPDIYNQITLDGVSAMEIARTGCSLSLRSMRSRSSRCSPAYIPPSTA